MARKKSEMEILLDKYTETFGEGIPLFKMMGYSEDQLIDLMERAIENNEPIVIEEEDDDDIIY